MNVLTFIPQLPVSLTGLIALAASIFVSMAMAADGRTRAYYFLLLSMHLLGTGVFIYLTLGRPADALRYYTESEWLREFGIGTQFISFILGWIRQYTDLTLVDSFLIFQLPGLVGIILIHKLSGTLAKDEFGVRVIALPLILLMPGLHLWTSSIGKDSIAIFAYGLIAASIKREKVIYSLMILGLTAYFFIRPHIFFMVITSIALAFILPFNRVNVRIRVVGLLAAMAVVMSLPFLTLFLGIDGELVEGAQRYLEYRQNLVLRGGSSFDISSLNPAERVASVLFRPFFFDASGIFGIVASFENLFLAVIFIYLGINVRVIWTFVKYSPALRFHILFLLIFLSIITQTTGNIGLALRYKIMMIPALYFVLISVIAYHNRVRLERRSFLSATEQD